jgi:hypothetical protein
LPVSKGAKYILQHFLQPRVLQNILKKYFALAVTGRLGPTVGWKTVSVSDYSSLLGATVRLDQIKLNLKPWLNKNKICWGRQYLLKHTFGGNRQGKGFLRYAQPMLFISRLELKIGIKCFGDVNAICMLFIINALFNEI